MQRVPAADSLVRKTARFTHVMTNFVRDVREKRFNTHATGEMMFSVQTAKLNNQRNI